MTALSFLARLQEALRKFRHAEFAPCADDPANIISNPQSGAIALGCLKCGRVIALTMVEDEKKLIEKPEHTPKPRFKL